MLDDLIKIIVKNTIAELNTTMVCTVESLSPLVIRPVQKKNYIKGDEDYPPIYGAKILKFCTLEGSSNFTDVPVFRALPLAVGNKVLVSFGKHNLSDAIILGVVE